MGFLCKCSKFGSLINFQCQYSWHQELEKVVTDQFCWIRLHFNLTGGGGIKEKEYGETEIMGNGKLFEGGGYFQYFHLRGAIIRGRQLIKEWLLFEGI